MLNGTTEVSPSRPVVLFYKYCQIIFAPKLSIAARNILLEYWPGFFLNSLSGMLSHMCFIIACLVKMAIINWY